MLSAKGAFRWRSLYGCAIGSECLASISRDCKILLEEQVQSNCIARAPPVPRNGFCPALSGVMQEQPKVDVPVRALLPAAPGFARIE